MNKALCVLLLLVLAGCSGMVRYSNGPSPCAAGEATYECQVERYNNVAAD